METQNHLKFIFMGTPAFAAGILSRLVEAGFRPQCVVTSPDTPAGRGLKLSPSSVKTEALRHHLPLLQPNSLKDPSFIQQLKMYNPDVIIVVAFKKLPAEVWKIPTIGTINLHASLLPQYRGAAPIQWAIINGETQTGVTTFFINDNIDTGDILLQEKVPITEEMTAGELHDLLMIKGANLIIETLKKIATHQLTPIPQQSLLTSNEALKTAPKIFTHHCVIDWNMPAQNIHRKIMGLSPVPGAMAYLTHIPSGKRMLIKPLRSKVIDTLSHNNIYWDKTFRKQWIIRCLQGSLEILELQPEGKKRMNASAFLNGLKKEEWDLGID